MNFKLEALPTVLYACFVLHNYCEKHNVNIDVDLVMTQIELMKGNEVQFRNIPDPVFSCDSGEGIVVRRVLTDLVIRTLRSGNGDGDGNLRSLGQGSLCEVGVSAKIEITIL